VTEDPDAARLAALEKRIEAAKSAKVSRTKGSPSGPGFSQGEVAWRMVIEMVSGMVLGLALGYGLDVLFGTVPIFLVIFSLLGFAAGVRVMMGTAQSLNAGQDVNAGPPAKDERD
jgi:ATP synthase protein I